MASDSLTQSKRSCEGCYPARNTPQHALARLAIPNLATTPLPLAVPPPARPCGPRASRSERGAPARGRARLSALTTPARVRPTRRHSHRHSPRGRITMALTAHATPRHNSHNNHNNHNNNRVDPLRLSPRDQRVYMEMPPTNSTHCHLCPPDLSSPNNNYTHPHNSHNNHHSHNNNRTI